MKTKKRYAGHSENCLEAHQGVGHNEGFTCTDNCLDNLTHTPTPWEYVNYDSRWLIDSVNKVGSIAILNGGKDRLATANAEFIVRAVNQHDQLVSENAAMRLAHEFMLGALKEAIEHTEVYDTNPALVTLFKQAIAKAEGR